jgi:ketosteroid isomerase-like protein
MGKQASPQTVELLRRFYESFNQRDIDAVLEVCAEEVEVYKDPEVVDMVAASTPRGHEHVAQYLRGWLDSWTDYTARPQEFVQSGDEVAVLTRLHARGRGSRFDIEEDMADLFSLEDGRIKVLRLYIRPEDALGAVA